MDRLKTCFAVYLVFIGLPGVRGDCHATDECLLPPDVGDGGYYPSNPLQWRHFDALFESGQPLPYMEVYNLNPLPVVAHLSMVTVQWVKMANGQYMSSKTGWRWQMSYCDNVTTMYTTVSDGTLRFNMDYQYIRFEFSAAKPGSQTSTTYVGTLVSSCPDRYLIKWACPKSYFSAPHCREGMVVSLLAPKGPENLPWQLVTKDLCRNNLPNLDDRRWYFTYFGQQCEPVPPTLSTP